VLALLFSHTYSKTVYEGVNISPKFFPHLQILRKSLKSNFPSPFKGNRTSSWVEDQEVQFNSISGERYAEKPLPSVGNLPPAAFRSHLSQVSRFIEKVFPFQGRHSKRDSSVWSGSTSRPIPGLPSQSTRDSDESTLYSDSSAPTAPLDRELAVESQVIDSVFASKLEALETKLAVSNPADKEQVCIKAIDGFHSLFGPILDENEEAVRESWSKPYSGPGYGNRSDSLPSTQDNIDLAQELPNKGKDAASIEAPTENDGIPRRVPSLRTVVQELILVQRAIDAFNKKDTSAKAPPSVPPSIQPSIPHRPKSIPRRGIEQSPKSKPSPLSTETTAVNAEEGLGAALEPMEKRPEVDSAQDLEMHHPDELSLHPVEMESLPSEGERESSVGPEVIVQGPLEVPIQSVEMPTERSDEFLDVWPHRGSGSERRGSFSGTSDYSFLPSVSEEEQELEDEWIGDEASDYDDSSMLRSKFQIAVLLLMQMFATMGETGRNSTVGDTGIHDAPEPCDAGGPSGTGHSRESSSLGFGGSGPPGDSNPGGGKRRATEDGDGYGRDNGRDRSPKKSKNETPDGSENSEYQFRCPYHLKYPEREYKGACLSTKSTTARVKEHLYREHLIPEHCPLCFERFGKDAKQRDAHVREMSCAIRTMPPELATILDGVDTDKRDKLKLRKSCWKWTELQKWDHIWKVLFPNDKPQSIPVPERKHSSETERVLQVCKDYLSEQLPSRLVRRLDTLANERLEPMVQRFLLEYTNEIRDVCQNEIDSIFADYQAEKMHKSESVSDLAGLPVTPCSSGGQLQHGLYGSYQNINISPSPNPLSIIPSHISSVSSRSGEIPNTGSLRFGTPLSQGSHDPAYHLPQNVYGPGFQSNPGPHPWFSEPMYQPIPRPGEWSNTPVHTSGSPSELQPALESERRLYAQRPRQPPRVPHIQQMSYEVRNPGSTAASTSSGATVRPMQTRLMKPVLVHTASQEMANMVLEPRGSQYMGFSTPQVLEDRLTPYPFANDADTAAHLGNSQDSEVPSSAMRDMDFDGFTDSTQNFPHDSF
jgi:hypothetical protein